MSIKSAFERVLSGRVAIQLGRRRRAGSSLILSYHNVVQEHSPRAGDRSLHLGLATFRTQLDTLASLGNIAPLDDVLGTRRAGLRFAITFDDAYSGAIANAIPELASRGLPATVFVAPGMLGLGQTWWDLLAGPGGLTPEIRTRCLDQYAGVDSIIRRHFGTAVGAAAADEAHRIATEAELRAALRAPGLAVAAHSWSHPNLSRLGEDDVRTELVTTLRWLSQWPPESTRPWLAYPYGLSNQIVRRLTAEAGYSAGLTIGGGWHDGGGDPMNIPRYNVPAGVSLHGFVARICGLLDP